MLFDQFVAKPPAAKSVLVLAETRPGYDGKPYIGKARTVAVAMLEAQVHHMTNDERKQILVAVHCRRHGLGQHVQNVEDLRVGHQRQVNEFLDLPVSNQRPDSTIFAHYLVARRSRGPIGAEASEVLEAELHAAVAPIYSGVKREAQTCHDSDIVSAFRTLR